MAVDPIPTSLEAAIQPEQFSTKDLQHQVMSLRIAPNVDTPSEPQSKRRKVSEESRSLRQVTSRIYNMLQIEPKEDLLGLGDELWYALLPVHSRIMLTILAIASLHSLNMNSAR